MTGRVLALTLSVVSIAAGAVKAATKDYMQETKEARAERMAWWHEARFGMFIHWSVDSQLGSGISHSMAGASKEYLDWYIDELPKTFNPKRWDPNEIAALAKVCGMKYVVLTAKHHNGFCLWDTKTSDFKSTNSPAKRDLVAELAENCHRKGLGLCLYYSHGRDWRHPHGPESLFPAAKVDYQKYVDVMSAQVTELLTHYGPIAAIWLDGLGGARKTQEQAGGKDVLEAQALYDQIRSLQPQVLISYKQGYLGTEDFMAPERHWKGTSEKPLEICNTLQGYSWGYDSADEGRHRRPNAVLKMLADAKAMPANLLLNTGPLPNGAVHPDDIKTLKAVGRRLRNQ